MIVVGLTGGVASGKSFVARCLEELGAHRIDADRVAHEVLRDQNVIDRIVGCWGRDILDHDGQINRKQLGMVVFGGSDDSHLDQLESIVHPEIRIRIRRQMDQLRTSAAVELLVLDIPLLYEGEYDEDCDYIIFVDANRDVRQRRAKLRGWGNDELERRESRQLPVEEKKLRSDIVIDNSGSMESTAKQLEKFVRQLEMEVPGSFRNFCLKCNDEKPEASPPNPPLHGSR